jgi:hypothetical protein
MSLDLSRWRDANIRNRQSQKAGGAARASDFHPSSVQFVGQSSLLVGINKTTAIIVDGYRRIVWRRREKLPHQLTPMLASVKTKRKNPQQKQQNTRRHPEKYYIKLPLAHQSLLLP